MTVGRGPSGRSGSHRRHHDRHEDGAVDRVDGLADRRARAIRRRRSPWRACESSCGRCRETPSPQRPPRTAGRSVPRHGASDRGPRPAPRTVRDAPLARGSRRRRPDLGREDPEHLASALANPPAVDHPLEHRGPNLGVELLDRASGFIGRRASATSPRARARIGSAGASARRTASRPRLTSSPWSAGVTYPSSASSSSTAPASTRGSRVPSTSGSPDSSSSRSSSRSSA